MKLQSIECRRQRQRDDLQMSTSYHHKFNTSSRIQTSNSPQYILCIAIVLLAIIIINSGDISLLVQAVEPPSVLSTLENGVSTPVKNSNENNIASADDIENDIPNDNNEEKRIVVGDDQRVEEKIIETIQSSDEKVFVEGDKIDVQDDTDNYVNTLLPEPKAKDGDNIDNLNIHDSKAQKDGGRRQRRMQRQNRDKEQKHRTDVIDSVDEVQQKQQPKSIQADYDAYMSWCEKVLGIKSVVGIQEFEYIDHLQIYWDDNDIDDRLDKFDWLEEYTSVQTTDEIDKNEELPTKLVRGLAAKHDIQVGDVVISIPLFSLLSIPTTIDHDPVLSRILGPEARIKYGFTDASEYELPLLVLAVLYHRSLGDDSPISHYIDVLLETSTDSFPFLWSDWELREKTDDRDEVKNLARGIRQDLHGLYNDVMGTLVRENREWFGPPVGYNPQGVNSVDWIYSYENFQWAFALVISRHHYLPISAFDDEESVKSIKRPPTPKLADYPSIMHETLSSANEVVPPANQPTDSWVDEAHNEERVVEDDIIIVPTDDDLTSQFSSTSPVKHSFLAPLADLINFGPPCLIGSYNEEEVSNICTCCQVLYYMHFNSSHLPLFYSMHLS